MIRLHRPKNFDQPVSFSASTSHHGDPLDAAFLKDVKEDQSNLYHLFCAVSTTLESSETTSSDSFVSHLLAQLRDQLALHFSLEEAAGYMQDVATSVPRLSAKVELLQMEHADLYLELSTIAEIAEEFCCPGQLSVVERRKMLNDKFAEFHRRLQRHDEAEDELILESLYVDIGGG